MRRWLHYIWITLVKIWNAGFLGILLYKTWGDFLSDDIMYPLYHHVMWFIIFAAWATITYDAIRTVLAPIYPPTFGFPIFYENKNLEHELEEGYKAESERYRKDNP